MGISIAIILIIVVVIILYAYNSRKSYHINADVDNAYEKSQGIFRILKFGKTWGRFSVTGSHYLSKDVQNYIWEELKAGDELKLIPDPQNQFDSEAIKVMFNDKLIGWFRGDYEMKIEVFNALIEGRDVKAKCISNIRGPEITGTGGNIKNLGFRQFVRGQFEYKKV